MIDESCDHGGNYLAGENWHCLTCPHVWPVVDDPDGWGLSRHRNPSPKWVDLFGIDPDYTDGKPVDEWLQESRGEA